MIFIWIFTLRKSTFQFKSLHYPLQVCLVQVIYKSQQRFKLSNRSGNASVFEADWISLNIPILWWSGAIFRASATMSISVRKTVNTSHRRKELVSHSAVDEHHILELHDTHVAKFSWLLIPPVTVKVVFCLTSCTALLVVIKPVCVLLLLFHRLYTDPYRAIHWIPRR